MFDSPPAPFDMLQRVCSASRAQACAAADRLLAIGELYAWRMRQAGETPDWAVDAVDAVTAEISAALNIGRRSAESQLEYATALREQLPSVGRVFIAGDIDEDTFRAIVHRTGLILDEGVMTEVDQRLSVVAGRWGSCNREQLNHRIDKIVASVDLDAVRRRRDRLEDRGLVVTDTDRGMSDLQGTLYAPDAHAFAERATALAKTVCDSDPRTLPQRRADAVGAMATGAERLSCQCGSPDCPAGGAVAGAVVIHLITDHATLDGLGTDAPPTSDDAPTVDTAADVRDADSPPVVMSGYDGLIPAEMVAELAASARLRPLIHPRDAAPEAGYVPSRALADYVRCRDLTCRFPGCTTPATKTDLDHTIPHATGGPTQASNLKCLCRLHHLVKTFWGWQDHQLGDGSVIWTPPTAISTSPTPAGHCFIPNWQSRRRRSPGSKIRERTSATAPRRCHAEPEPAPNSAPQTSPPNAAATTTAAPPRHDRHPTTNTTSSTTPITDSHQNPSRHPSDVSAGTRAGEPARWG